MAEWTTITDEVLEPGKPIRSVDILALRDNPVAIASGASGAPRIDAAALKTGNPERDWVLDRTASASVGAVGTYAFVYLGGTGFTEGSTRAGSSLHYGGIFTDIISPDTAPPSASATRGAATLAGTWRIMGRVNSGSALDRGRLTVALRIS
jgi:hypothetical protein